MTFVNSSVKPQTILDQDQDSLLVKRRNDSHSPGPVIRELVPSSHHITISESLQILDRITNLSIDISGSQIPH